MDDRRCERPDFVVGAMLEDNECHFDRALVMRDHPRNKVGVSIAGELDRHALMHLAVNPEPRGDNGIVRQGRAVRHVVSATTRSSRVGILEARRMRWFLSGKADRRKRAERGVSKKSEHNNLQQVRWDVFPRGPFPGPRRDGFRREITPAGMPVNASGSPRTRASGRWY